MRRRAFCLTQAASFIFLFLDQFIQQPTYMLRSLVLFLFFPIWGFSQAEADIYDPALITQVNITFAEENWADLLADFKENSDGQRLTAQLQVNGVEYDSVGIRYKGNSSYNAVYRKGDHKLPFNIKIDHIVDDQELPGGYDKIKLSNGFRDPSFVREVLGYEIARTYMPASRANFAQVYVNGEYLGVYTSVESVDKQFLEGRFGEKDGVLVKCDPVWGAKTPEGCLAGDKSNLAYLGPDSACYKGLYEMKSDRGWKQLIELTRILAHEPDSLEEILDIDQTLWWLAFNNVLVNLDSYQGAFCHNYYLYQDEAGVFHPIIWDLNLAFGGFNLTGLKETPTYSGEDMQQMSMFLHYKHGSENRPLLTVLLENDLYRKIYVAHCKTILQDFFAEGQFLERAKNWQQVVEKAVFQDTHKLYSDSAFVHNVYTTEDAGGQQIIGVAELMNKRAEYLLNHKLIQDPAPLIQDVAHSQKNSMLIITAQVRGADDVWIFYQSGAGDRFRKKKMTVLPQGATASSHGFSSYEISLPYQAGIAYYLVGEGAINASVYPQRAGRQCLSVDQGG